MTEYTTSSEAVREYMTSRERTAYWVQAHSPDETDFYSPSAAPSVLDGFVPPSPSEAESSRSIPPRMVLRYSDGRPDIPIAYNDDPTHSSSKRRSHRDRSRSGSYSHHNTSSPLARSHSRRERSPEEIRVLPSHPHEVPRSSSHHRAKSLPRNLHVQPQAEPPMPFLPQSRIQSQPIYAPPAHVPQHRPQAQQVTFSQPQPQPPQWHPYAGRAPHAPHLPQKHVQPPISYAPANYPKAQYSPPALYSHPPQMGPNGMIYSHSIPPTQYPQAGMTSHHTAAAPPSHLTSVHEERSGHLLSRRNRAMSMATGTVQRRSPSSSSSSLASEHTYYVPTATAGQKVHIIVSLCSSLSVCAVPHFVC